MIVRLLSDYKKARSMGYEINANLMVVPKKYYEKLLDPKTKLACDLFFEKHNRAQAAVIDFE